MLLELNDIAVDCVIGDLPDERNRNQRLLVTLSLEVPDEATRTDALADTVDYAALAEAVRQTLVAAKCRLIERAAGLAAETAMRAPHVRAVAVRVVKTGAVSGLASAAVRHEVRRDG